MSEKKRKGTPLWQISKKFNFAAEKIIPDSFVFCVVLTLVVAVLSLTVCHIGPVELLTSWWDGLSSQFTLAFQMGLMVVVQHVLEAHRFPSYLMAFQVLYTHV